MAHQPAPVAAQIPVIHAPQQSNTIVAPVQAVPGVVHITYDLSAFPERPFRTLGVMHMKSMERNIEANNANLMLAIRQENYSRYGPRHEVKAMSERMGALERTTNCRINPITYDLGRIRDVVPDQSRLTAPDARLYRNNHTRFAWRLLRWRRTVCRRWGVRISRLWILLALSWTLAPILWPIFVSWETSSTRRPWLSTRTLKF